MESQAPKALLVIHGEKGGLGKSLFARILVSYLHTIGYSTEQDVTVYDADGDGEGMQLTRTLPAARPVRISEPLSGAQILDTLMEEDTQRAALIDLGARQHREFRDWMAATDVGALIDDGILDVTVYWLIGGTLDSVHLLKRYLPDFDYPGCRLVVVRNLFFGMLPAFDGDDELQQMLFQRGAAVIDLPVLPLQIAQIIDGIPAALHDIVRPVTGGDRPFPQVGFTTQRVLGTWLGDVCARLDDAQAVPLAQVDSEVDLVS